MDLLGLNELEQLMNGVLECLQKDLFTRLNGSKDPSITIVAPSGNAEIPVWLAVDVKGIGVIKLFNNSDVLPSTKR